MSSLTTPPLDPTGPPGRGRGDQGPPARRVAHDKISALALALRCSRLAADEQCRQVVPPVERAAPDDQVGVQHPLGDRAALEGGRTEGPELRPPWVMAREPRDPHDGAAEVLAPRGDKSAPVLLGAAAPHGGVALAGRQVDHEPHPGSLGVQDADARGVEGHTAIGIGGTVDRIDHRQQSGGRVAGHPGLLGEHGHPRAVQHRQGGTVGRQVEQVLPRLPPARSPALESVQRAAHGRSRLVEHVQEASVVHG